MASIELSKDERRGKVVVGVTASTEKEWKEAQEEADRKGYKKSVNAALSEKVTKAITEIRAALTAQQANGRLHEDSTER